MVPNERKRSFGKICLLKKGKMNPSQASRDHGKPLAFLEGQLDGMRAGWHGDYPCITIHPHAFFLLDFDRSTEDAPRKGHDIECCCASSKQASSGNVRAAQELLADMNEIAGIQACLDSELDVIASAISFNIGVPIAVQRVDQLLEDKRYSAELLMSTRCTRSLHTSHTLHAG